MAKSKTASRKTSRRKGGNGSAKDAIALLKADHRQVEKWFGEFKKARDKRRKATLAEQICDALKVHTRIEEEIFYPRFLAATGNEEIHHEAEVEHDGAKRLIALIEENPSDDYFDARVSVLSEMIRHHVKEEEKPGGMFAEARKSAMDLTALAAELEARKIELEADGSLLGKARKLFEAA